MMKRKVVLLCLALALFMGACGTDRKADTIENIVSSETDSAETTENTSEEISSEAAGSTENSEEEKKTEPAEDLEKYLSGDIKETAVQDKTLEIALAAGSLQEELERVEAFAEMFNMAGVDQPQGVQTFYAERRYLVWDTEFAKLWSKIYELPDGETKDRVLSEQKNWINIRDMFAKDACRINEGGSMYDMLLAWEKTAMTRSRTYYLASVIADAEGLEFELPEREPIGKYIYTAENDETLDTLMIFYDFEEDKDGVLVADIDIEGIGHIRGTLEASDDDTWSFEGIDEEISGSIGCGWNGAVFLIGSSENSNFHEGEMYEFPILFR